jgi:hypothetical protein
MTLLIYISLAPQCVASSTVMPGWTSKILVGAATRITAHGEMLVLDRHM